jgi:hypothetical protein
LLSNLELSKVLVLRFVAMLRRPGSVYVFDFEFRATSDCSLDVQRVTHR